MDDLAERIARLSPAKQALLALRLRERERATASGQTIPRRPGGGPVPLSFAQQRLWFLDQLEPDSPLYNITRAFRIRGPLDAGALREALDSLIARHETLRTTFVAADGEPAQVIAEGRPAEMVVSDLPPAAEGERAAEVQRLLSAEARRPVALSRDPMLRAILLRLGAEDHVLCVTIHHIVSDWWSMRILLAELGALYGACLAGAESPLPELPIQYADYAVWQRDWLRGEALERQLAYWRGHLGGAPPALELPTDRPRPAVQTYRGARESLMLPGVLADALKELARREGATLFMTLLAAYQTLLHRYTGQEDLVIGSAIAGRTRVETEGLIGFFVNTLVLRTDLSGDPPFREALARARATCLGAYAHQDLPFEKLVEELQPERTLGRTPLFQTMLVLQDSRRPTPELAGLAVEPLEVHTGTAKFDLSLTLVEAPAGLQATLEYSTDLFDASTMRRLLGHLGSLLQGIVADPDRRLSALPLLTDAERHQLLVEWNTTRADFPKGECLHHGVEAQAAWTPDAAAVAFRDRTLTYRELNRRADRLARRLRRLGVGPDVLVGICMERCLELVVGLLGILKAGGAYLPLDPGYPVERLAFMLADSAAPVLLTQAHLRPALPANDAHVLCLDENASTPAPEPEANLPSGAAPDSLAYVLYTSGSTGRPKGVIIPHRAIQNHMRWMAAAFPLTARDVVLQKTPLSFDASVWEFWAPLHAGARLVLAEPDGHRDPAYLARALAEHAITRLQLVPSQLRLLLEEPGLAGCAALRHVFCGGEALPPDLVARFVERLPWAALHNLYGPTEVAIDAACWTCTRDETQRTVPIGRPIANTEIYLLDAHGQPVPIGVPGELHIGGAGLARGYLNQPELTAEKFIPHPFQAAAGARLYKTGDLARYRADGALEFLGRADTQVKLRGFRIELGEIETALAAHQAVREAVVAVREDAPGDQRLVAYVVPAGAETPTPAALRAFLQATLPDYMLPSAVVTLPALPLTPSGKVDRRALPAPDLGEPEGGASLAPRTPVEEVLAGIWADVLGRERVGVADNFFELGGHSLLATRVMARVCDLFQVEMPLRRLFETPTVAGLAKGIEITRRAAQGPSAPPIRPVPRGGPLPLSFAQQRLWFLGQLEPDSPVYNIPWAVRLAGPLDDAALHQALDAIVARHEALRTTVVAPDGMPVQVIGAPRPVNLSTVDLRAWPDADREAELQRRLREEARRPFILGRDLMVRAALFRLGEGDHVLLLVMHHIASDGWSMGGFFRELTALYAALARGRPPALPELPIQYADYAVWQREWLQGEELETQLAYWRRQLAGNPPALELPTDRPRPSVQSLAGARRRVVLPRPLADALAALSRREGATLFMTLLAAFAALLHRYTGQDDIVVGSPIAGRTRTETEGLIGFFVNTLVLRNDLSGDPTFRELLGRVREGALGAYEHQDVPFERLVEELRPERSLGRSALFQVLFALQNAPVAPLDLPGLRVQPLELDSGTAKFDLSLQMMAAAEGLRAVLEYNTDLFDAATVTRLLEQLRTLLEGIAADPDRPLSALPLVTAEERHQLLITWNATASAYPRDACLHHLFEAQVARTPEAVALAWDGGAMPYAELNARANQVAHRLRALGVGPDVLVGVCLDRSPDLIVALLGILKAGGAYLPLDPEYPPDRLTFMLQDAVPAVCLTTTALADRLRATGLPVLRLDAEAPALAAHPTTDPPPAATGDSLAYVMYTSGSTGLPKGTLIPQRGVVRLVMATDYVHFGPDEVFLQFAPIAFDASTFEIWGALLHGARLVLAPPGCTALADLGALLRRHRVTTLWLTAGVFHHMVDHHLEDLAAVPQILAGGDVLSPSHVHKLLALPGARRLINGYGPTENTTFTCTHTLTAPEQVTGPIPIGRPIANTRVYVLDPHGQPAPLGVPGELYIGGDGLARGYLNRPELTAERFVPDPFGPPGGRLYRTGDLVRWRPDDTLAVLGRNDTQVKIRGFRVECGEVEAVLARQPGVREAVVVALEDVPGEKRLVAYVVPTVPPGPAPAALRAALRDHLPDYMVPAAVVVLDALPLNPNGKVDRGALPAPTLPPSEDGGAPAAPRDALEIVLAQVWERVLGLRPVRPLDNFFDLGGHSLLAVRLLAAIAKQTGRELPLATLFRAPTIAQQAELLRRDGWAAPWTALVPLRPGGSKPPLFCVHQHHGHIYWAQPLARHLGPDRPVYGLEAQGLDGRQPPRTRIEVMAAHYVQEIRSLQPEGPYHLSGYCFGGLVAFEMAQQLVAQGQVVALVALVESAWLSPERLAQARRLRARLRRRFLFERDRLAPLGPGARVAYLVQKATAWAREAPGRAGAWFQERRHAASHVMRTVRQVEEANLEALRRYAPVPYSGRVVLFRPAGPTLQLYGDPTWGWGELAAGGIEIEEIPKTRPNIVDEPDARALAARLTEHLEAVARRAVAP